jgi:hypothetical protein
VRLPADRAAERAAVEARRALSATDADISTCAGPARPQMRAARSTASPSTSPSAPRRSLTSPMWMPVRTPADRLVGVRLLEPQREEDRALGVSNVRKQPSPAQLTMRPSDSAASRRTCARCLAMSSPIAWSPRCVFNAVEPARSVKTSVRMREVLAAPVTPGDSKAKVRAISSEQASQTTTERKRPSSFESRALRGALTTEPIEDHGIP